MRTIKFRAWDIPNKKMYYSDDYKELDMYFLATKYECEQMQFTGLLDKNGVQIFEGDIICDYDDEVYRVDELFPVHRHTHVTNIGYFMRVGKKEKYNFRENLASRYDNIDDWMSWPEQYEIIGNIYSNPELITN